jgi:hypothetical protein
MSYARFSSSNWRSEVYVYEDVSGGWTTHVSAMRRVIPPIPDLPVLLVPRFRGRWDLDKCCMVYPTRLHSFAAWVLYGFWAFWHSKVHMWTVNLFPMRRIRLPYAGETFNHGTPGECADWLLELRSAGYHVPQYAIDALREEHEG